MNSKIFFSLFSALVLIYTPQPSFAEASATEEDFIPAKPSTTRLDADDHGIFSFVLENDKTANTDGNYTNGVRLAWSSSEKNAPQWVKWVGRTLMPFTPNRYSRISVAAGQSMFTPSDITIRELQPDERPYAGWLYGSVGIVTDSGTQLDNLMLTLGWVGPHAYAERTQKIVHNIVDAPDPKGWDNQLKDEPGIVLSYEHKWRSLAEFSPFGFGADATPHIGVNLGNVYTDASAGIIFRLGYDLPADYGPPRIRPSLPGSDFFIPTRDLGWYVFAGIEGRGIARNIFLDGNTFKESHHVEKEPLTANAQVGFAVTWDNSRLSYTHVFNTREYATQRDATQFGALTYSYRF